MLATLIQSSGTTPASCYTDNLKVVVKALARCHRLATPRCVVDTLVVAAVLPIGSGLEFPNLYLRLLGGVCMVGSLGIEGEARMGWRAAASFILTGHGNDDSDESLALSRRC